MFVRIIGYLCDSQAINILIKTRNEEKRSEGFSEFPDFGFFLFQTPNSKLKNSEYSPFREKMFRMLQLHENLIDYLSSNIWCNFYSLRLLCVVPNLNSSGLVAIVNEIASGQN